MDMAKNKALIVIVIFLLSALWFFFPLWGSDAGNMLFAMRLALPATILAIGGIGLFPRLMTLAFFFCAVGDAMGVIGSFEGQMGGFAIAHLFFICQFVRDIRQSKITRVALTISTLLCLIPLIIAGIKVIPAIRDLPIRIGCIVYALLLCGTLWTSLVRALSEKGERRILPYITALGAFLFLISDFILSWNKFTSHVNYASLYIMTTYYCALLFLFIGTLRPFIKKS